MKGKKNLFILIFSLVPILLWGINFHDLNLSNDDRLLFKAEFESQNVLFVSALETMSIQQLTAHPEKLQLVNNGRTLITVNRFGAASIPLEGGLPSALAGYPSFAEGSVPLRGRLQELAVSADGKWLLCIEPTSAAFGDLLLVNIASGIKRTISEKVELPASDFPAKWSPDSRLFVYSKGGRLFYFPILNDMSMLIDERFRMLGEGGINSILWGQNGVFYYFFGNTLYSIISHELFTRSIYGDFLYVGNAVASFPFDFDPGFDYYWVAPAADSTSGSVVVNKGGKNLFFFSLGENQGRSAVLPHATIPYGAENLNILWSAPGRLAVIFNLQNETIVWRYETGEGQFRNITSNSGISSVPLSVNGNLSPDGTLAVFWGEGGLELWDFTNWRLLQKLSSEPVLSCVWVNNNQLISGNKKYIEEIDLSMSNIVNRRICLSAADEFGFEAGRGQAQILARVENNWFATDGRTPWIPVNNPQLRPVSVTSERYRVFLDPQHYGHFSNIIMIRNVHSTGTVPFTARHSAGNAYTLGRPVQMALCFDLYDDDTGLQQVLTALHGRGLKATFFLNGDFIRRNPHAAAAIAEAGHETASMFYTPLDFSDSRYRITTDFITQGLARNEDEFFKATGKELSLLWHPPFYRSSVLINSAAAEAGYKTIARTIDPGDWLSKDDANRLSVRHVSPSEMVEKIIREKQDGAVVPIRLGLLSGGMDEYLFQRIEVLLDAFERSGIEVVPVSAVTASH